MANPRPLTQATVLCPLGWQPHPSDPNSWGPSTGAASAAGLLGHSSVAGSWVSPL